MSELFTLSGTITGSGTVSLSGDLLYSSTTVVRMPKGMNAKVWCKRITASAAGTITVDYSPDITVASPTYIPVIREYLAAAGEYHIEKRRPTILRGITGNEGFRVSVSGTGTYTIDLEVEFEE